MFGKYLERKRVVNQIVDELSFDTTFNNLPDLAFKYEIKNHFLFIQRESEPQFIVYDFEANTFRIPSVDHLNICASGHRKRLLKALIIAHANLAKRDAFLLKIKESRSELASLVTGGGGSGSDSMTYLLRGRINISERKSSDNGGGSPGSSSSRNHDY